MVWRLGVPFIESGVTRREYVAAGMSLLISGCVSTSEEEPQDDTGETADDPSDEGVEDTTPTPSPTPGNQSETDTDMNGKQSHPSLESQLEGLATADDTEAYAKRQGLDLEDGEIKVTLELTGSDAPVPDEADVATRFEDRVDAWVAVEDLIPVADAEHVEFVRLPRESQPSSNVDGGSR